MMHFKILTSPNFLTPFQSLLGANEILALANVVGLTSLNISSCSFDEGVDETLLYVLRKNKTLRKLNISINKLNEDLGVKIISALADNEIMRELDVRGAGISHKTKRTIDGIILENREKNNTVELCKVKEPDNIVQAATTKSVGIMIQAMMHMRKDIV